MKSIVYYVATSLDGFISGPDGDISGFVQGGNGVTQYLEDLQQFKTVIMGRKTYEFGYSYGLQPGQPAYPHMQHYIFSQTLEFTNPNDLVHIKPMDLNEVDRIRNQSETDVYLCGGGDFAGWLLDHARIDILRIKLNPLVLGTGVRLFGNSKRKVSLQLLDSEDYELGLKILTYQVEYVRT